MHGLRELAQALAGANAESGRQSDRQCESGRAGARASGSGESATESRGSVQSKRKRVPNKSNGALKRLLALVVWIVLTFS